MTRLVMGDPEVDAIATKSLRKMELKAKNRGDTSSAILSAGYYARKLDRTMYGYAGNSYGSAVWRVSDKPSEYLNPINNTGRYVFSVTPDLTVARHEVRRPEDTDLTPNADSPDLSHLAALELRLSHERERLRAARTSREKAFRAQQVAGCEREIAGERKFLSDRGVDLSIDDDVAGLSDDELLAELESNPASYYVWVLHSGSNAPLSSEGPYGPYSQSVANQFARISAKEGIHDRAVSVGKDPLARGFKIERRYAARTGLRLV